MHVRISVIAVAHPRNASRDFTVRGVKRRLRSRSVCHLSPGGHYMLHDVVMERSMRYVVMWKGNAVISFLNSLTQATYYAHSAAAVTLLRCAAPDEVRPTASSSCSARVPPVPQEQRASSVSSSAPESPSSSRQRAGGQRHRLRPLLGPRRRPRRGPRRRPRLGQLQRLRLRWAG